MSDHPISDHIARVIGTVDQVSHEFVPPDAGVPAVHVHHVPPTRKRPFHALVTEGMSYRPLMVQPGDEPFKYQELMMLMPKSWHWGDEKVSWPIFWLRYLAQYAHRENTYFAYGHSFGNGPDCAPLAASVETCAWLFLPPIQFEESARELRIDEQHVGRLVAIVPIYHDEYRHIVDRDGLRDVLDGFEEAGVSELYDPERRSVLKK